MIIRAALPVDAPGMSAVLQPILTGWNSDRPGDTATVLERYVNDPDKIACSVAELDGRIVGFQSLKRATETNPYGVEPGWGIIGTYVALDAGRGGIGSALFAVSEQAARAAGLAWIDATIGKDNAKGLAYYRKMGFAPYRDAGTALAHRFQVR